MSTMTVSEKGAIQIPPEMRNRYGLRTGVRVHMVDYGEVLAVIPSAPDPIAAACGMFSGGASLSAALMRLRRERQEWGGGPKGNGGPRAGATHSGPGAGPDGGGGGGSVPSAGRSLAAVSRPSGNGPRASGRGKSLKTAVEGQVATAAAAAEEALAVGGAMPDLPLPLPSPHVQPLQPDTRPPQRGEAAGGRKGALAHGGKV